MSLENNASKSDKQFCMHCNIALATRKTFQAHLRTRKHRKRCEELSMCSRGAFKHVFSNRLFDIASPGIITMEEAIPWLDLARLDLEMLVKKIFPPRLHWSTCASHPGFSLNEFKILLIAARTDTSWRAFQYMRDIRAGNAIEKPSLHEEAITQLDSAWKIALIVS